MSKILLAITFVATFFCAGASRPRLYCDDEVGPCHWGPCHWGATNGGAALLLGALALLALAGAVHVYLEER